MLPAGVLPGRHLPQSVDKRAGQDACAYLESIEVDIYLKRRLAAPTATGIGAADAQACQSSPACFDSQSSTGVPDGRELACASAAHCAALVNFCCPQPATIRGEHGRADPGSCTRGTKMGVLSHPELRLLLLLPVCLSILANMLLSHVDYKFPETASCNIRCNKRVHALLIAARPPRLTGRCFQAQIVNRLGNSAFAKGKHQHLIHLFCKATPRPRDLYDLHDRCFLCWATLKFRQWSRYC